MTASNGSSVKNGKLLQGHLYTLGRSNQRHIPVFSYKNFEEIKLEYFCWDFIEITSQDIVMYLGTVHNVFYKRQNSHSVDETQYSFHKILYKDKIGYLLAEDARDCWWDPINPVRLENDQK
jgi:hypothetical protein